MSFGISALFSALVLLSPYIGLGVAKDFVGFELLGISRRGLLLVIILAGSAMCALTGLVVIIEDLWKQGPEEQITTVKYFAVLAIVGAVAGGLFFELYFRWDLRREITYIYSTNNNRVQNQTLQGDGTDKFINRTTALHQKGLFKVNEKFDTSVIPGTPGRDIINFSVQSNNFGLLSNRPYEIARNLERPEYRIVMLGDSMTGPTTSTYQWVDVLEDLLNGHEEIKQAIGGKTIRVYNLGWVGAGFENFWLAYDRSGRYFSPDMVVANFIELDFPRNIRGPHFSTIKDMVANATVYLNRLFGEMDNVILTLMPIFNDLVPDVSKFELTSSLTLEDSRFEVINMANYLPIDLGLEEISSWYNLPHDNHFSDKGGEVYARAMAKVIGQSITKHSYDFSQSATAHSNEVMGPDAPKTRSIKNSVSYFSNNKESVSNLRRTIIDQMVEAKVFGLTHSYLWDALTGSRRHSYTPPYTESKFVGGLVPIQIGDSKDSNVFLNVMCSSYPVDLGNAECFTLMNVFLPERNIDSRQN